MALHYSQYAESGFSLRLWNCIQIWTQLVQVIWAREVRVSSHMTHPKPIDVPFSVCSDFALWAEHRQNSSEAAVRSVVSSKRRPPHSVRCVCIHNRPFCSRRLAKSFHFLNVLERFCETFIFQPSITFTRFIQKTAWKWIGACKQLSGFSTLFFNHHQVGPHKKDLFPWLLLLEVSIAHPNCQLYSISRWAYRSFRTLP